MVLKELERWLHLQISWYDNLLLMICVELVLMEDLLLLIFVLRSQILVIYTYFERCCFMSTNCVVPATSDLFCFA